jgi:hypothetical protein
MDKQAGRRTLAAVKDAAGLPGAAFLTAAGAGAGAALAAGAWAKALLAVAIIAVIVAAVGLARAVFWQSDEQDETNFRRIRAQDADARKVKQFHRQVNRALAAAFRLPRDESAARAAEDGFVEAWRRFLSDARRGLVDLLVIDDSGDMPVVLHSSGRFERAVLNDSQALVDWLDALAPEHHCEALVFRAARNLRLVAASDEPLDAFDRGQVVAAANSLSTMMTAHAIGRADGLAKAE